jgi:hypothetical protein
MFQIEKSEETSREKQSRKAFREMCSGKSNQGKIFRKNKLGFQNASIKNLLQFL